MGAVRVVFGSHGLFSYLEVAAKVDVVRADVSPATVCSVRESNAVVLLGKR